MKKHRLTQKRRVVLLAIWSAVAKMSFFLAVVLGLGLVNGMIERL